MIVEFRTYRLKPGSVPQAEERFGQALPARTKPHYRFPYGDFRDVHRCAVRAAEGQEALYGVARFLDNLLETARVKPA